MISTAEIQRSGRTLKATISPFSYVLSWFGLTMLFSLMELFRGKSHEPYKIRGLFIFWYIEFYMGVSHIQGKLIVSFTASVHMSDGFWNKTKLPSVCFTCRRPKTVS